MQGLQAVDSPSSWTKIEALASSSMTRAELLGITHLPVAAKGFVQARYVFGEDYCWQPSASRRPSGVM